MGYLSRKPTSNEPPSGEDVYFHKLSGHLKCIKCQRWFKPDTNELPPYSTKVSRECFDCLSVSAKETK